MKVGIILGSVRPGRMGDRVGKMIAAKLEKRQHAITWFDPAKHEVSLLQKPLHFYSEKEEKPEVLVDLHRQLCEQDAFVFVTPEYNFSIPPALSNFIDHFPYDCWTMKPGSVVTYSMGNFGGIVAGSQLRTMAQVIQIILLPKGLTIPNVHFQIDEDGQVIGDRVESINKNANRMLDDLDFLGTAIINQKMLS